MVKGFITLQMEHFKVHGKMEKLMDLEFLLIKMEINYQEFINKIEDMGQEQINMRMDNDMREILKIRVNVGGVNIFVMMVLTMMDIGKMIQQMDQGKKYMVIKVILLDIGKMTNKMEKDYFVVMVNMYFKIGKWGIL